MSNLKKQMPQPDRVEASKIAVEARRARARLKEKLRSGEVSHLTILKQSLEDKGAAATLRITEFLLTLQGVGKTKVPKILDELRISDKKRLGGLGVNQRVSLEKYLRDKLNISQHSNKQTLTVLAGPTAVGKGTVAAYIREHYPEIKLSVSATTRAPRPGEVDGVHYHFMSDEEFDRTLAEGGFLEWAFVHNAYRYGTLKDSVLQAQKEGNVVLLEIDLQGARQVSVAMPDARMVFLAPPSWEELVRRLIGRGTESEEEQKRRLETAKIELASANEFDEVIVNDTVTLAAERLAKVMLS